jgi:predicted dehydrogenase
MKVLNFALIGLGNMGRKHYRALCSNDTVNVAGLVDPGGFKSSSHPVYPNVEELLKSQQVDCAVVATPTKTHTEICQQLIHQGIHLLIEKPITFTVEEAEYVQSSAEENNCKIAVGHIERFNPAVQALVKDLASQEAIKSCHMTRIGPHPYPVCLENRVGVLLDLGIHDVDLARFINKFPQNSKKNPSVKNSVIINNNLSQLDDRTRGRTSHLLLELPDKSTDIPVSIFSSYESPFRERSMRLLTRGPYTSCYDVDLMNQIIIKNYDLGTRPATAWGREYLYVNKSDALQSQLEAFVKYVHTGEIGHLASTRDAIAALRVIKES